MASPDLSDLERTAREIVRAAMLEGTLSNLTIRKVRDQIETIHELERGFLLAPHYKYSLKAAIQDASAQAKIEMKDEEARLKSKHTASYERDISEGINDTVAPKKQQDGKYKSAEFVENSSDSEELSERNSTRVSPPRKSAKDKIKSKKASGLKPPPKKRQKIVDSNDESTIHLSTKTESKVKVQKDSAESDDQMASPFGDTSESKNEAKTSRDKSRVKKTARDNSKGEGSDKHDTTIKRLKSLVHACGVRKPWVKIFRDIPKPTQQIKKLKEILSELGMTGRMSMEQAKRIRSERELAQELEDVKSFEHSMLNRSRSRTADSNSHPSIQPIEFVDDEDSENEDDIKHRRRKIPASRNIDAFIGGESDVD